MLSHSAIKLNHTEMHCDDVEWIQEARYMGQGLDPVNTITEILAIPGWPTSALFTALTQKLQQEFPWTSSMYISLHANNYLHTNVGCWLT
jgi:hypothetical protein